MTKFPEVFSFHTGPYGVGDTCERTYQPSGQDKVIEEKLVCCKLKDVPKNGKLHLCRTGLLDDVGKPDRKLPHTRASQRGLWDAHGRLLGVETSHVRVWRVIEEKEIALEQKVANI